MRIELVTNFNATTLRFVEKFDHQFSHVFLFGNIFHKSHGFVTACAGHKFEQFRFPSLIIDPDKLEQNFCMVSTIHIL